MGFLKELSILFLINSHSIEQTNKVKECDPQVNIKQQSKKCLCTIKNVTHETDKMKKKKNRKTGYENELNDILNRFVCFFFILLAIILKPHRKQKIEENYIRIPGGRYF